MVMTVMILKMLRWVAKKWTKHTNTFTVVPGFRVRCSALTGFRALKAVDGAWPVHETLFRFRAPISSALNKRI